jgi:hypothetical protein
MERLLGLQGLRGSLGSPFDPMVLRDSQIEVPFGVNNNAQFYGFVPGNPRANLSFLSGRPSPNENSASNCNEMVSLLASEFVAEVGRTARRPRYFSMDTSHRSITKTARRTRHSSRLRAITLSLRQLD